MCARSRANAEINFRNGGSAEGSLARRGGRSIPIGLDLPTQHSQRPLAAPALSQAILSEVLGRRPGRNGLSAASSAQGQGLRTLAFASSWQTGYFASAIWKFLSAFALEMQRSVLNQSAKSVAYRNVRNPANLGPFLCLSLVAAAIFDWILYGTAPNAETLLGGALVLSSALTILLGTLLRRKANHPVS